MADDGTEDDERAAAALDQLRRARTGPDERTGAQPVGRGELIATAVDRLATRASPATLALAVVAAVVLGAGTWFVVQGRSSSSGASTPSPFAASALPDTTLATLSTPPSTAAAAEIVVHAAGAVVQPGLHHLQAGARVADLLDAAGGPTAEADLDRLNLAAPLADGQRLYVPRVGETAPAPVTPEGGGGGSAGSGGSGESPTAGPIDLNTATAEQLESLPGIGPATSAAIIDHRKRNGPFGSVDDLLDVRGIGPAKLEGLRDLVTVG